MKKRLIWVAVIIVFVLVACSIENNSLSEEEQEMQEILEAIAEIQDDELEEAYTIESQGIVLGTFEPVMLSGNGQTVTDFVNIPFPLAIAAITHDGSSNFSINQYDENFESGRPSLVMNRIGIVEDSVLLDTSSINGLVSFSVAADGNWTITIKPLIEANDMVFSGTGTLVTGVFQAPANAPWHFTHDGSRNFIVQLYSSRGTYTVINERGVFDGTTGVNFGDDLAFWIVRADGNWTIRAQ